MPARSPIAEVTKSCGAIDGEYAEWLMPAHFGQPALEYEAAVSAAVLFDVSHFGTVTAIGREAGRFLHNLCTNEVLKLPVNSGCEAFFTSGQAKIAAYCVIYNVLEQDSSITYWIDAGPGMGAKLVQHLDRFIISEQVELADRTANFARMHLAGPRAGDILMKLFGKDVTGLLEHQLISHEHAGSVLQIRKHTPLSVPGFDLLCPGDAANKLWQSLVAAGTRPAGLTAYEILRVEAGTPVFGQDIDDTNLPQEVNRTERTVSFTKGCYIGQETIARIRTYGHVNRTLAGLSADRDGWLAHGNKVTHNGKDIGSVTSGVFSPRLGKAIAMAYLRRGSQEPGTMVEVKCAGGAQLAQVTALPFIEVQANQA